MIKIFTPSFADESDTNAQNLTVKEVVARLDPEKFYVTMLAEAEPDPRIVARPNTRLLHWRGHGNTIRTLLKCLRELPDVYFYPREGPLDASFLKLRRTFELKTAVLTHVVSGSMHLGTVPRTLTRNVREADLVFGNCRYISALLRERLGAEADTIHNGIDRRFFFPEKEEEHRVGARPLRVFSASSFRAYKRMHLVIERAATWPDVHFRIAGRGEEEERCRKLAHDLCCRNLDFLGHLTPQQLGEEMRCSDVFFHPSMLEGHPQVLGQAAASGLPVVAMGMYRPDYVIDGQTGLLATSDEDLDRKLDLLLTQEELRKSMSKAAVEHAKGFNWDQITRQWEAALESAVARRRGN